MKKLTICMISVLLISAGSATAFSFPGKDMLHSSYNSASCTVKQNRGKTGILVGVVGVAVINRLLDTSVGRNVKAFVKRACSDVWDFFRGIFVGNN